MNRPRASGTQPADAKNDLPSETAQKAHIREHYLVLLRAAGTSKLSFAKTMADLTANRRMDISDLSMIATAYIGASKRWKNRRAALLSIQEKFSERAFLESKIQLLNNNAQNRYKGR